MLEVLTGATWQHCRVHFMRNALSTVPKVAQQMVAATLRTIFAQPDLRSAHDTVERICALFEKRYPKLVEVLREAETDVLAYYGFPVEHRRQLWSTNSLERLNKEVSRRCDVVGIFPSRKFTAASGRRAARRTERRVGCGPPLLQHRAHEQALRTIP